MCEASCEVNGGRKSQASPQQLSDDMGRQWLFFFPLSLLCKEGADGVFDDSAATHTHTHFLGGSCQLRVGALLSFSPLALSAGFVSYACRFDALAFKK